MTDEHRPIPMHQWYANPRGSKLGFRVAVCRDCGRPVSQDEHGRWQHTDEPLPKERVA